jgi:hypothetical protein
MRSITASALFALLSLGCATSRVVSSPVSYTNTKRAPAPSVVEAPAAPEVSLRSQDFAMVIKQQERLLLVIDSAPSASLSSLEPVLMSYRESEVVLKKSLTQATPAINGWLGQQVALFGEGRQRCVASVKDVYLQGNIFIDSEAYPFGQEIAVEPMTDADFAQRAWESGRVLLVAELNSTGPCEGATFGRLHAQGAPTLARADEVPPVLLQSAMEQFRLLAQYQEIQADYSEYPYPSFEGDASRSILWESYSDTAPKASLFRASNGRALLSVAVDVWGGCGDFNGSLFALFEVNQDQSLRLLASSTQGINPHELLDVQGDGAFEIIQGEQWYELINGQYQTAATLYIPWDMPVCNC